MATDRAAVSYRDYAKGFAPIARADARILILGSLPSRRSLDAAEYYAHPRNAFWRIMAAITGAGGTYEERCGALVEHRIALWDVLAASERPGSMDADIRTESALANDFGSFFAAHAAIERIVFNGRKAAALFGRLVPSAAVPAAVARTTLPSTSPAHASLSFPDKFAAWRSIIG